MSILDHQILDHKGHYHASVAAVAQCYGVLELWREGREAAYVSQDFSEQPPSKPLLAVSENVPVCSYCGRAIVYRYVQYNGRGNIWVHEADGKYLGYTDKSGRYDRKFRHDCNTHITHVQPLQEVREAPVPLTSEFHVPMEFFDKVPDGYYAAQVDEEAEMHFFRVKTRKTRSRNYSAGSRTVQTQHGPNYREYLVKYAGDDKIISWRRDEGLNDTFMTVLADPIFAGRTYAKKKKRCCRCNTELTDPRSRYYGIGPECEKHWPQIIRDIDDLEGPFGGTV